MVLVSSIVMRSENSFLEAFQKGTIRKRQKEIERGGWNQAFLLLNLQCSQPKKTKRRKPSSYQADQAKRKHNSGKFAREKIKRFLDDSSVH